MSVSSFELCKQLYELSGWDKTQNVWAIPQGEENSSISPWLRTGVGSSSAWKELPAYDTGYLLRKLPLRIVEDSNRPASFLKLEHEFISEMSDGWSAGYSKYGDDPMVPYANGSTPEDACCALVIELFKRGILPIKGKRA